jgi:hypothetical protein
MSTPETAKWEEALLEGILASMRKEVDVGVLVTDSLGKNSVKDKLSKIKAILKTIEE